MTFDWFMQHCRSGAMRSAAIVHRGDCWEVWAHVGPTRADSGSDLVTRLSTLPDAYQAIRSAGYAGTVEVDEAG